MKISPKLPEMTDGRLGSENAVRIIERRLSGGRSALRLSDGSTFETRRFVPVGKGDVLRFGSDCVETFVKHEPCWITIDPPWIWKTKIAVGPEHIAVTFKEIETAEELEKFDRLRQFHYRAGGAAGRIVPIIATCEQWDLPQVLGFIEISSSMIANTARKRFFDYPFFESAEVSWRSWDTAASKNLSNIISRISRFVIHPELRSLGLARHFLRAAELYSIERWHYGGRRPRFIEITADMLRYYKFISSEFAYMGETEGNEHRLVKDMTYLVKRALSDGEGMPQGGGGIMTLQRGYASKLLRHLNQDNKGLTEVVRSLQHDPALLDQETWESLHRLNRKPKVSFVAGLTRKTKDYVTLRQTVLEPPRPPKRKRPRLKAWSIVNLSLRATTSISQTSEARTLQDAFGFVGANLSTDLIDSLSFELIAGELTVICGASGSGKSLLLAACSELLSSYPRVLAAGGARSPLDVSGEGIGQARVSVLPQLPLDRSPLELRNNVSLESFLEISGKCGLAEPQLFVRPIHSLSSGQRYRLRLALAFMADPEILFIDNFCEPLDRYTAFAVTRGLKRLAIERRVAIVGATAAYDREHLLGMADQSIMLRRGNTALVVRQQGGG